MTTTQMNRSPDTSETGEAQRIDLGVQLPVRRVPAAPPTRQPMAHQPDHPKRSLLARHEIEEVDEGKASQRRKFLRDLYQALGPITRLLEDPNVSDIHRNSDGTLLVSRLQGGTEVFSGFKFDDDAAERIISMIATEMKTEVSPKHPRILGVLPLDGSRFSAVVPPISDAPSFTIRKHAIMVRTFEDYLEQKIMTQDQVQFLRKRIRARDNMLIVGATASGKTTFANAVLREAAEASTPNDRFLILEDTRELQCPAVNKERFMTDEDNGADMDFLLATGLRYSPSRIIVGELRGKEAATFIEACNTGHHGGLATIHSSTVENGLVRLETLIRKVREPSKLEISNAIQTVVAIEYNPELGRRRVTEIKRIASATEHEYRLLEA